MFVSYAQNFEDVILWRALKHVDRGFYIDIGAQDPDIDSVSKGFFEKGWRGLHVEPIASYAQKLRDARGDEEVIEAAIGTTGETLTFYEIPETGLSTGDAGVAEKHRANNLEVVKRDVAQMRLSALFDHVGERDIHWLKIDVEGMEQSVIDSWSPSKARPWVVVVESTLPNSPVSAFAEWEPQLVDLGYEFVYFDGLNRFYVSIEHRDLASAFGPGPNYFDRFRLASTSGFVDTADLRTALASAAAELEAARKETERVVNELQLVYRSPSWRLTKPLRRMRWLSAPWRPRRRR